MKTRILIVDDDECQLLSVQAWLEAEGHDVFTHNSPFGTAARVRREKPDLVVLDVAMPGLDGPALADLLQRRSDAPAVVFYAAQSRAALEALAREHGAIGAIPKTQKGQAFLREFRQLYEGRQMGAQRARTA